MPTDPVATETGRRSSTAGSAGPTGRMGFPDPLPGVSDLGVHDRTAFGTPGCPTVVGGTYLFASFGPNGYETGV